MTPNPKALVGSRYAGTTQAAQPYGLNATEQVIIGVAMMDADEAKSAIRWMRGDLDQIDLNLSSFRQRALDFADREGWKALGYASSATAINAELGTQYSKSYLSRLLGAAKIERLLELPTGNPIPERVLRPLANLDTPEQQKQAWEQATAAANGNPSAKIVQQAVDTIRPAPWPAAPDGWRWSRRGAPAHLIAPDGWQTHDYDYPERALAEAQRRILSQPKATPAALPADLAAAGYAWHSADPPTIAGPCGWHGDAPTADGAITQARDRETARDQPYDANAVARLAHKLGAAADRAQAVAVMQQLAALLGMAISDRA